MRQQSREAGAIGGIHHMDFGATPTTALRGDVVGISESGCHWARDRVVGEVAVGLMRELDRCEPSAWTVHRLSPRTITIVPVPLAG